MREAVRMVVTLLVVCLVAGIAAAGANEVTAPLIAQQQAQALQDGLARVLPAAASFDPVPPEQLQGAGEAVKSAWRGLDGNGKPVGIVVEAAPDGYGGAIRTLVGVKADGSLEQMTILSASGETAGLGAKVADPAFQQQFAGLKPGISLVKGQAPSGNQIQAVTGATISSQAVLDGVNQALAAAKQIEGAR